MAAMITDDDLRLVEQAALKALAKPNPRERGPRHEYGDGDPCPMGHGRMYHLKGVNSLQWCPHSTHEGQRARGDNPVIPPTRSYWPTGIDSFATAVAAWREPNEQA